MYLTETQGGRENDSRPGVRAPDLCPGLRTMSTTATTHETVSDVQPTIERRSWNYAYVGEDSEGRHHHLDRKLERVVVSDARAERDDSGAVPVFTITGDIEHTESILLTPDGESEDDLKRWIAFVDEHRGWSERPVSAADTLQDVLREGI